MKYIYIITAFLIIGSCKKESVHQKESVPQKAPTISSVNISEVSKNGAKLTFTTIADECGYYISTDSSNVWSSSFVNLGAISGSLDAQLTGLSQGVKYFLGVSAKNSNGTTKSNIVSFVTITSPPSAKWTYTSTSQVLITSISARFNYSAYDLGQTIVSEHGICWSTNPSPTVNDSKKTYPNELLKNTIHGFINQN